MILHYLKITFRRLMQHKIQNLMTICCLSIGMLSFSLYSYYVNQRFYNPYSHLSHYKRMVELGMTSNGENRGYFYSPEMINTIEKLTLPGIEALSMEVFGRITRDLNIIKEEDKTEMYQGTYNFVNSDFFVYNGYSSIYNSRPPKLNKGEAVFTEKYAKKIFGNDNPIGYRFYFEQFPGDDSERIYYTIKDVIANPHSKQDPEGYQFYLAYEERYEFMESRIHAVLKPGYDKQALENVAFNHQGELYHLSMEFISEQPNTQNANLIYYAITLLIASLVLIAGLINFLKCMIQSYYNRQRELGLRKSLGSSSAELFWLLFYEILIMLLLSLSLTTALSEWIVPYLTDKANSSPYELIRGYMYIEIKPLLIIQAGLFLLTLFICCIVASVAVIRVRNVSIRQTLVGVNGSGKHWFRNLMIGLQLSISFFFAGTVIGNYQIIKEYESYIYTPLSDDEYKNILSMQLSSVPVFIHKEEICRLLEANPAVKKVMSMDIGWKRYKNKNGEEEYIRALNAGSNYFSFFQIPLLKGRMPETGEEDIIYISEKFEKRLQKDSIEGYIIVDDKSYRIAGVYKALNKEDLLSDDYSAYIPTISSDKAIYIQTTPGNGTKVKKELEEIVRRFLPDTMPLNIEVMYDNLRKDDRQLLTYIHLTAITILAFISLFITILSTYSAISLDTEGRQKEIAIRKINGATPKDISLLFGRLYAFLLLISFILAFPLVYIYQYDGARIMKDASWRYFEIGIGLFLGMSLLLLLTIGYKIYRIMKLDPAKVIKSE